MHLYNLTAFTNAVYGFVKKVTGLAPKGTTFRAALSIWWALRTSPCWGPNPSVVIDGISKRLLCKINILQQLIFCPLAVGALRTSVSYLPVNAALITFSLFVLKKLSSGLRRAVVRTCSYAHDVGRLARRRRRDELTDKSVATA